MSKNVSDINKVLDINIYVLSLLEKARKKNEIKNHACPFSCARCHFYAAISDSICSCFFS